MTRDLNKLDLTSLERLLGSETAPGLPPDVLVVQRQDLAAVLEEVRMLRAARNRLLVMTVRLSPKRGSEQLADALAQALGVDA